MGYGGTNHIRAIRISKCHRYCLSFQNRPRLYSLDECNLLTSFSKPCAKGPASSESLGCIRVQPRYVQTLLRIELHLEDSHAAGIFRVQHFREAAYYQRLFDNPDIEAPFALLDMPQPFALCDRETVQANDAAAVDDDALESRSAGSSLSDPGSDEAGTGDADDGDSAGDDAPSAGNRDHGSTPAASVAVAHPDNLAPMAMVVDDDGAGADASDAVRARRVRGLRNAGPAPSHDIVNHIASYLGLYDVRGNTIRYGAFSLTFRVGMDGTTAWTCVCPWHRRNKVTGCISSIAIAWDAEPDEHIDVLRRLMQWAHRARAHSRQWQHLAGRPRLDESPHAAWLVANVPVDQPPAGPAPTDIELDAAAQPAAVDAVDAASVASSRGRGRGRARGRAAARGRGRLARGRGRAAASPPDSSQHGSSQPDPSQHNSDSDSSESNSDSDSSSSDSDSS